YAGRMADVYVRPGRPEEGERLREIAAASKAHWGYDPERVRDWVAEGDFTSEALANRDVFVADEDGLPVAFASLIDRGEVAWLDARWVGPDWIGGGVGSRLFRHCAEEARRGGARRMEWEAEPNAVGFYERMGARYLRDSETSEWGRVLAVMGVDLS